MAATTYVVRANYEGGDGGSRSLVSSEDVFTNEDEAQFMFTTLRALAGTVSASIMRHREYDGQVESIVLDLAMSEGVV